MGFNRQDIYKKEVESRECIPYCKVHNKFQRRNGGWLDAGINQEELNNHVIYTRSQEASILESICDVCDNPNQLEVEFEEY